MRLSTYTLVTVTLFALSAVSCKKKDGNTSSTVVSDVAGTYVGTTWYKESDSEYINHYGWSKYFLDTSFSDTIRVLNYPELNGIVIYHRDFDYGPGNVFISDTYKYSPVDTYSYFLDLQFNQKRMRFSRPTKDSLLEDYHKADGITTDISDRTAMFRGQKVK